MENVTTQMQQDIHELKELVQKLYTIIAGHELDKESGLVSQVKDHEARIKKIETFKDRVLWLGIGMIFPAGYGTVEAIKAITTIFK